MSKLYEYAIVYVDDESMSLKYFEREFSKDFNVFTASSAADGWEIIQKNQGKIGILMSDQRMPGQTGVQLLEKVRHSFPHIIRILVTAYSDIDSAVAGVNAGAIYRYINKPWDVTDLRITLLRALEFFGVIKERDHLLREKLSVLHQIVLCDRTKNLGVLAAGLSSHFRNPLRAAHAFVAAIPQAPLQSAVEESLRGEMGKNVERLLHRASEDVFYLAQGMKEIAESPLHFSLEPLPLPTLLNQAIQRGASHPPRPVDLRLDPALPGIRASGNLIVKLFTLLISNMLAVADENTSLRIEAMETTEREGKAMIKICVSDPGPDWSSEQRAQFFSPFASLTQNAGNLGLDLVICYFIVHHHGGRITVPGAPKPRVVVELPLDAQGCEPTAMQSGHLADLFRREMVLA